MNSWISANFRSIVIEQIFTKPRDIHGNKFNTNRRPCSAINCCDSKGVFKFYVRQKFVKSITFVKP